MTVHKVKINNVVYGNVGNITPSIEQEFYYDVTTLDGTKHRKIRWQKTNYTVQFFNLLDDVYVSLRDFIKANKNVSILCGFPDDEDGFVEKDYNLTLKSEINKGYRSDGKYYKNGMVVLFEAVKPDE